MLGEERQARDYEGEASLVRLEGADKEGERD